MSKQSSLPREPCSSSRSKGQICWQNDVEAIKAQGKGVYDTSRSKPVERAQSTQQHKSEQSSEVSSFYGHAVWPVPWVPPIFSRNWSRHVLKWSYLGPTSFATFAKQSPLTCFSRTTWNMKAIRKVASHQLWFFKFRDGDILINYPHLDHFE